MNNNITGIILAAGTGSRLGNITKNTPKALVEVNKKPLIYYAIEHLKRIGVSNIKVIGGFYFNDLHKVIKKNYSEVKIFENKNYLKGNLYTLNKILPSIDTSFILVNIDHIYHKNIANKIRKQFQSEIVAFTDNDRKLFNDDMKVLTTKNEKYILKISKKLTKFNRGYVGITYCPRNKLDLYKNATEQAKKKFGKTSVVENVLQVLANNDENVISGDISGSKWYEIDFPEELKIVRERILKDMKSYTTYKKYK